MGKLLFENVGLRPKILVRDKRSSLFLDASLTQKKKVFIRLTQKLKTFKIQVCIAFLHFFGQISSTLKQF